MEPKCEKKSPQHSPCSGALRPPGAQCDRRPDHHPPMNEGLQIRPHSASPDASQCNGLNPSESGVCRELSERIRDFGERAKEGEAEIRALLSQLDPISINNLRYGLFAPHYDRHMAAHETAIANLLGQLVSLQSAAFPDALIGKDLLEMSCGTGTVIDRLLRLLPASRIKGLRIVANDLSGDMQALARDKLAAYPCDIGYTGHELGEMTFKRGTFNTVILSQTLHLIIDSDVQRQERESNYMFIDEHRHVSEKLKVLRNAWWALKEQGVLVIIDEWPALLSDRGGPLGSGFAYLFNDGLRPIDLRVLQDAVVSQLPSARYICQLKVPIDSHHHMYLIAYRKERDGQGRLPDTPGASALRDAAVGAVMNAFSSMDAHLLRSMAPADGNRPFVEFIPIGSPTFVSSLRNVPAEAGSSSCIVLRQVMHNIPKTDRFQLIGACMNALAVGGSLVIIDEWLPPEGSAHPLRQTDIGSVYMGPFFRNLVSAGAVRVPIYEGYENSMYGYQFRKVI